MSCWSPVFTFLTASALILAMGTEGTEAKRGCANWGHSCYGGMGKRAEVINPNGELLQDIQQDDNPDVAFTGLRNDFRIQHEQRLTPQEIYNLSPLIRQWVRIFKNAQEVRDERK